MIRYPVIGMSRTRGWIPIAAFGLLLVLFAARLGDTSVRKTLTVDEPHYIGAGLYLLLMLVLGGNL